MKKLFSVILILSFFLLLCGGLSVSANSSGHALFTDIVAYINNVPIKSYNIEGLTAVAVRDLENYGFNVSWDEVGRVATVTQGPNEITGTGTVYKNANRLGMADKSYVCSDIVTKFGEKTVPCYIIEDSAFVIFNDFSAFGDLEWNENERTLSLTLPGKSIAEKQAVSENPDVTLMYSKDGRKIYVGNRDIEAFKKVGWFLFDPNQKLIALTFDDGPGANTDKILDVFEKYDAKATFFVVGNRVNEYAASLKRAYDLGMEIGSHSFDHANLTKLSKDKIIEQKKSSNEIISKITGAEATVFRPPYGVYNDIVLEAYDMPVILWTVDTIDWKTRNAKSTSDAVLNGKKDFQIVLMHDIHAETADAAEIFVPKLIAMGYKLVTVTELITACRGSIQNQHVYYNGRL